MIGQKKSTRWVEADLGSKNDMSEALDLTIDLGRHFLVYHSVGAHDHDDICKVLLPMQSDVVGVAACFVRCV